MIGTLTDLARRPGMPSEPTLRRLMFRHPDFPIVEAGRKGRSYRIDIEEAEAFVRGLKAARAVNEDERRRAIKELGLTMLASAMPVASAAVLTGTIQSTENEDD